MKSNTFFLFLVIFVSAASLNAQSPQIGSKLQDTEIAPIKLEFENNGYLKQELINSIRDEQLRVKAISAFEYALPIVGMEQ